MKGLTFEQFINGIWILMQVVGTLVTLTGLAQIIKPVRQKTVKFIRHWLSIEDDATTVQTLKSILMKEMELSTETSQRLETLEKELVDSLGEITTIQQGQKRIEDILNNHTRANGIIFDFIKQNSPLNGIGG